MFTSNSFLRVTRYATAFYQIVLLGVLLSCYASTTLAEVLFSENFNSYAPGTCVGGPVWTQVSGCALVIETPHPGWDGNAVTRIYESPAQEPAWIRAPIANAPTAGVLELSFKVWAPDVSSYSEVHIDTNLGLILLRTQGWGWMSSRGHWLFLVDEKITGRIGAGFEGYEYEGTPAYFIRDRTVWATIVLDYNAHELWVRLSDGTNEWAMNPGTGKWPLLDSVVVTGIGVYLYGSVSTEFDDIILTLTLPAQPVVKPTKGGNTGQVTMSLTGNLNLAPGTVIRLSAPNVPDIVGQDTEVFDTIHMRTTFNLLGATPGLRDVVITLPNSTVLTLKEAFTVEDGGSSKVTIRKGGITPVPGRVSDYFILVENTGNVDAHDVNVVEYIEPWFAFIAANPSPTSIKSSSDLFPAEDLEKPYKAALTWNLPSLRVGELRLLSYQARLDPVFPVGKTVRGGACWSDSAAGEQCLDKLIDCGREVKPVCTPAIAFGPEALVVCQVGGLLVCEAQWVACMSSGCDLNELQVRGSRDPNEKTVVARRFIGPNETLLYPIHYENVGDAEAQNIFITDVLDPNLDLATLELLTPGASLQASSRKLQWDLLGRNLPPSAGDSVVFSIRPKVGLPSGTEIRNRASIQFEVFAPMETNEVVNIIDDTVPTCLVSPLPVKTQSQNFPVTWTGTDTVGEIASYSVYVSTDSGNFKSLVERTVETSTTFTGTPGHTYGFLCRAVDTAGNQEAVIDQAEATTQVVLTGDTNEDGVVNCADIAIVKASFGKRTGQPGFDPRADVTGDGAVDVRDLSSVSRLLPAGTTCK